jgi:hypothetical protein
MHSGSLEEDIPTLLSRPELLKPCIDLALENILCHSLSIVEVGASREAIIFESRRHIFQCF